MPSRLRSVVAGLVLLAVAGCSDDTAAAPSPVATATATTSATPAPASAPAPAPTVTVTETAASPSASEVPTASEVVRGDCSSSDASADLPDAGVTDTVAATRKAVFLAALACDYDALGALASANPEGFSYSFGDDGDPAGYWREAEAGGDRVLFALATLLRLEPREQTEAGGGDYVVWPAAFVEDATDADWEEVADLGIYTPEEVEQLRAAGSGYAGWRTGIDADGNWDFFIAGD